MMVEHATEAIYTLTWTGPSTKDSGTQYEGVRDQADGYIAALIYKRQTLEKRFRCVKRRARRPVPDAERGRQQIGHVYGWWPRHKERTHEEWLALFRELEIPGANEHPPAHC